jgi:hypothetical protein
MDTQKIEGLIKNALDEKRITFEISIQRKALVLSVPLSSDLVGLLDQVNNLGMANLVPLDKRGEIEPTPLFHIGGYTVLPMVQAKRTANGCYLYDFFYTPK